MQARVEPQSPRDIKVGLTQLRSQFGSAIMDETWQAPDQVTVTVDLASLPAVVEAAYYQLDGWLSTVLANDERSRSGAFALYYVLSIEPRGQGAHPAWLTVRALVPAENPEFPSVAPRVPAATWSEREIRDMFGLQPSGLPDTRRLILPDDWPEGIYPLRKDAMDYGYRPAPAAQEETYSFAPDVQREGVLEVPLGPLHVSSDEPGHFRLYVEGEQIVDADYRLFYCHRGIEKLAENKVDYDQATFLAERICGICGYTHSVAYTSAIEAANHIDVPDRAQYIRTILLEVERLHSHLLNLGLVAHLVGFDAGFMHFFRVREKAMEMAEILTGGRKTYGINVVGGVRRDILGDDREKALRLLAQIRSDFRDVLNILLETPNFFNRTRAVGRLDPDVARNFSPVGPNLRGSGYKRDTRADHAYAAYPHVPWQVITKDGCDVLSRVLVRAEEVEQSLNILEACLSDLPSGPILATGFSHKPYAFALGYTEAPRGENVHWVMVGPDQKVFRWRPRAATYNNWPALRYMLRGNALSDAPLIVASIDPCYSCAERVTIADLSRRKTTTLTYRELERYCRDRRYSPLKG